MDKRKYMNDQIVMCKKSGKLEIAIPLYRLLRFENEVTTGRFYIDGPLAYLIYGGVGTPIVSNSEIVESNFEFLGDL